MLREMAIIAILESSFFAFLTGFNYAHILFTGTGNMTFPEPDDYQKIIDHIKGRN